jgi:hypothetical protein
MKKLFLCITLLPTPMLGMEQKEIDYAFTEDLPYFVELAPQSAAVSKIEITTPKSEAEKELEDFARIIKAKVSLKAHCLKTIAQNSEKFPDEMLQKRLPTELINNINTLARSLDNYKANKLVTDPIGKPLVLDPLLVEGFLLHVCKEPKNKFIEAAKDLLDCAAYGQNILTLDFFLAHCPQYLHSKKAKLFHVTIKVACPESVAWFHQLGIDINTVTNFKQTGLHIICSKYSFYSDPKLILRKNIIMYLLKHGIKINQLNAFKETALDYAMQGVNQEIIDLLRTHGAKKASELKTAAPDDPDKDQTLITYAAAGNTEGIVQLLDTGSNINAQDIGGNTALMLAARNGYKEAVEMLLKYGGKRTIKNRYSQTAVDLAKESNQMQIAAIINTHH